MSSDQVGGDTQERHGSLQVITVPVVTRSVEDIIMNIEGHASSVTDTECVLERTLRDRDWPEPELLTLHKHGSEPGAGQEVTTDVMQSPSGEHQEQVTVTPPRHEQFVLDSRPMGYLHEINELWVGGVRVSPSPLCLAFGLWIPDSGLTMLMKYGLDKSKR